MAARRKFFRYAALAAAALVAIWAVWNFINTWLVIAADAPRLEMLRSTPFWWLDLVLRTVTTVVASGLMLAILRRAYDRPGAFALTGLLACLILLVNEPFRFAPEIARLSERLDFALDHVCYALGAGLFLRFTELLHRESADDKPVLLTSSLWFWAGLVLIAGVVFFGRDFALLEISNQLRADLGARPVSFIEDRWVFEPFPMKPVGIAATIIRWFWLALFAGIVIGCLYNLVAALQKSDGEQRRRIAWLLVLFQLWLTAFLILRFTDITMRYQRADGTVILADAGVPFALSIPVLLGFAIFGTAALGTDLAVRRTTVWGFAVFVGVAAFTIVQDLLADYAAQQLGLPESTGTIVAAGMAAGVWHIAKNRIRPVVTKMLAKKS